MANQDTSGTSSVPANFPPRTQQTHGLHAAGEETDGITGVREVTQRLKRKLASMYPKVVRRRAELDDLKGVSNDGTIGERNTMSRVHQSVSPEEIIARKMRSRMEMGNYEKLESEIQKVNDRMIDTVLKVSDEATEDAAAEGKHGIIVTCLYRGIAVVDEWQPWFKSTKRIPLGIHVPPHYPEKPPTIWPESIPDSSHPLDISARNKFSAMLRTLPEPLTVTSIGKLWNECSWNAADEMIKTVREITYASDFNASKLADTVWGPTIELFVKTLCESQCYSLQLQHWQTFETPTSRWKDRLSGPLQEGQPEGAEDNLVLKPVSRLFDGQYP